MNSFKIGDFVRSTDPGFEFFESVGRVVGHDSTGIYLMDFNGVRRFAHCNDLRLVDTPEDTVVTEPSTEFERRVSAIRQDAPNEGVKGDGGKPDPSLISPIWVLGVSRVLTYGSVKRGAHNWRKGLKIARLMAGAIRHIFQFLAGEDIDRDDNCPGCQNYDRTGEPCPNHSNEHHLDCASCNLMFARELQITRPELDDRFNLKLKKPVLEILKDSVKPKGNV